MKSWHLPAIITTLQTRLDGQARVYAFGTTTGGTVRLQIEVVNGLRTAARQTGFNALMLDANGNELLRLENVQDSVDFFNDLEVRKTYILFVLAPPDVSFNLNIDLPGATIFLPVVFRN